MARVHSTHIPLPNQLPLPVERKEALGAEGHIDPRTIRHRRRGCETPGVVPPFMRKRARQPAFPKQPTGLQIKRHHPVLVILLDQKIIMGSRCQIPDRSALFTDRNRSGHQNLVPPYDWCRVTFPWNRNLPSNILRLRPNQGRASRIRTAILVGATPIGPAFLIRPVAKQASQREKAQSNTTPQCPSPRLPERSPLRFSENFTKRSQTSHSFLIKCIEPVSLTPVS